MNSVLGTKPWQTFTQRYWQVEPIELRYAPRGDDGPTLTAVSYRDAKGRLVLPPYQPHTPIQFVSSGDPAPYRIARQWLEAAQMFVDDMIARGIHGEVTLSPDIIDPRPWLWSWFRVTPRFTYFIDFPFDVSQADRCVRQNAKKAAREGFVCRQTDRLDDAIKCLNGSEKRKSFNYGMTLEGLEMGISLLGPDAFRVYVCYAADGEPAAARVLLHRAGGPACDWIAGTTDKYLHSGATQQLIAHSIEDAERSGATSYNFCGADMESLSQFKLRWGCRLATQYSLFAYEFRPMKHLLGNMVRYLKRQRAVRKGLVARPS